MALSVLVVIVCVMVGVSTSGSPALYHRNRFILVALLMGISTLILAMGTVLGGIAARRATPRAGDIALAIFVAYAIGQGIPLPILGFLKVLL